MMSCKHLDLNHRPSTPPMEDLKAGSNGKSQVWLKPESDIASPWSCRPWTHHQRQAVFLVEVMGSGGGGAPKAVMLTSIFAGPTEYLGHSRYSPDTPSDD